MALIGVEGEGSQKWLPSAPPQGGPVKKYKTVINGIETTLLLNDADAEARGLKKPAAKADEPAPEEKAQTPANKSRQPANKRASAASKAFTK